MAIVDQTVSLEDIGYEVNCAATLLRQARFAADELQESTASAFEGVALLLDSIVGKIDRAAGSAIAAHG